MRRLVLLLAAAAALAAAQPAATHIRYACGSNQSGYCTYFNGNTRNDTDTGTIDPINAIWYPYGGSNGDTYGGATFMMAYQLYWTHTCGSDQWNHRWRYGATYDYYANFLPEERSWATSWCPDTRYHTRVFDGHAHGPMYVGSYYDWSVGDVHHESFPFHNIDRDWDAVEWHFVDLAASYGHGYTRYWQYLPRAYGNFGGYQSDGWASRVGAHY